MAGQESSINITAMEGKTKENARELMHRVPKILQQQQKLEKYFKPRVVLLGFHPCNEEEFPVTIEIKRTIKSTLLLNKQEVKFENIITALEDAKALYIKDPLSSSINSNDFNDMMILDACFIIHVMDHITKKTWSVPGIRPHHLPLVVEDMFLLENQVPFGVLEAVMNLLEINSKDMITAFVDIITQDSKVHPRRYLERFDDIISSLDDLHWTIAIPVGIVLLVVIIIVVFVTLPSEIRHMHRIEEHWKKIKECRECFMRDEKPFHLLQILRADLLFYSKEKVSDPQPFLWRPSRCATELKAAGINFESRWTCSLEDIKYKRGIILGRLCLPSITHLTKGRLLNLIAYELCSERCGYGLTSYVCFLDGLIDRPEDVKELRSKNILPKGLGNDEEVAEFFNMVGTDLALDPSSYYKVLEDIETHCYSKWRTDMADIRNKYFSSRLATISFVIATLLLLITIAQAYATFFPVKK